MKRTDKYRDSYQYDNQNQNHRRQSEDASYRQQYAKGDPEEHPERYYNGRDYRREQILEEKTRNPAVQKNGYISLLPFS
ncbi:membrane protein [Staphylococcus aureus]|nr:membrane protein [Staphylococcus aureus]